MVWSGNKTTAGLPRRGFGSTGGGRAEEPNGIKRPCGYWLLKGQRREVAVKESGWPAGAGTIHERAGELSPWRRTSCC